MKRGDKPIEKLLHDLLALLVFGILLAYYFGLGGQGCHDDACVTRVLVGPWVFIFILAGIRFAFYKRETRAR